jgi:hypothetical protein
MKKLLMTGVALLMCSAAHAGNIEEIALDCKPSLDRSDKDPVTNIYVIVDVDKDNNFKWLNVIHKRWSGENVFRFQQYDLNFAGNVDPEKKIYGWDGFLKTNRNLKMVGDIYSQNGAWFYRETLLKLPQRNVQFNETFPCTRMELNEPIGDAAKADTKSKVDAFRKGEQL